MPRAKKQHLKRRKDGRYCCKYQGKQFLGNTEDEAFAKRDEYKRSLQFGQPAAVPTVGAYADSWLKLYKHGVSDKCYNDYAKQLDPLINKIGDKRFDEVSVDDAKGVYLHFDGYSQSTIKRARMLYVAMFDTAMENGYCTRNPFRNKFAQPDRGTEGTHRIITDEERNLIFSTPHRMRLPALVMLYAGLRRGEALAIRIEEDVDLQRGVIHVRQAVRFDSNQPIITTTKTAHSVRDVPLFPILADELRGASGWLVQSVDGKQATESAFSRGWENYLTVLSRVAGHPIKIRCHDLRHSFCTLLRDSGVDMKLAMLWMGHADEKMILRIYDHVTESRAVQNRKMVVKKLSSMQKGMQDKKTDAENGAK